MGNFFFFFWQNCFYFPFRALYFCVPFIAIRSGGPIRRNSSPERKKIEFSDLCRIPSRIDTVPKRFVPLELSTLVFVELNKAICQILLINYWSFQKGLRKLPTSSSFKNKSKSVNFPRYGIKIPDPFWFYLFTFFFYIATLKMIRNATQGKFKNSSVSDGRP